ncbi:hypothetical protein BDV95DRAFT_490498 [Massariosphaeria phaeospora]|uniref:Uncharacterized protein n=1 Tax=Massariosphaeria phaeospora TaxID=100035 RepID=A0A7C8IFG7_9PLEO|nr:hypothetical protein BDV95DRAFT_490498 [Massariosphaeria phaeospora]
MASQTSRTLRQLRLPAVHQSVRALATTPRILSGSKLMGSNPQANMPDSNNRDVRKDTPNTDQQSSASQDEGRSGDDHPAKQPDHQAEPSRTTGIGGKDKVTGGKEGLGERTGQK